MWIETKPLTRRGWVSLVLGAAITVLVMASGNALAAEQHKLRLASEAGAKGSPVANSMDMWAKLIQERTDGRIKINVFYQGELGGQQELFDQLVKGNVDMMLTWPMTSYDPRIGITNTPYLTLSWDEALEAYKPGGWLAVIIDPIFEGIGLKFFGPWPEGFGGVATRGKYATTVESAVGIKVRSQPIFPQPQTMRALGYEAVPIDWGEVYTSIQTGIVDGDSGNIIYWDYEYFRDVVDYYVHTRHNFSAGALVMNAGTWDTLDPADQKIIADAADEVITKQFDEADAEDRKWIQTAIDSGMEYIEPSSAEHAALVATVRAEVWPQIEEKVGKYIMDQIRENATEPAQ